MKDAPMLRVVEVPAGLSPQEAEEILNAPYADNYYLVHPMIAEPPIVFRAVFKRRQLPDKTKSEN